jgi:small GTP-binding protein
MDLIVDRRVRACYKVVLLGESQVGKTSIISRQRQNRAPDVQPETVACHCSEIAVMVDTCEVILQVWDTAGQEMYRALVPVYLRGARAALLVYDVADQISFDSLPHWYDALLEVAPSAVSVFIVGNKIDLAAAVKDQHAKSFAQQFGFRFFRVSAVTGEGIANLFEAIAEEVSAEKREQFDRLPAKPSERAKCEC